MSTSKKRVKELQDYFKSHSKSREQRQHSSKVHSVRWNSDGEKIYS
mgnify:CR=1